MDDWPPPPPPPSPPAPPLLAPPPPRVLDLTLPVPARLDNALCRAAGWEVRQAPGEPSVLVLTRVEPAQAEAIRLPPFPTAVRAAWLTGDAAFVVVLTSDGALHCGRAADFPVAAWDTLSREVLGGSGKPIVAVSATGWLAVTCRRGLVVCDLRAGDAWRYENVALHDVCFSPAERWLVGLTDDVAHVYALTAVGLERAVRLPCAASLTELLWFDEDQRLLLRHGRHACLYALPSGLCVRHLLADDERLSTAQLLDPRGDPAVRGLSLRAHSPEAQVRLEWEQSAATLLTTGNGSLYRWDAHSGALQTWHASRGRVDGCAADAVSIVTASVDDPVVVVSRWRWGEPRPDRASRLPGSVLLRLLVRGPCVVVHTDAGVFVLWGESELHVKVGRASHVVGAEAADLWALLQWDAVTVFRGERVVRTLPCATPPEAVRVTVDTDGQCALVVVDAALAVECWHVESGVRRFRFGLPAPPAPYHWALCPRGVHVALLGGLAATLRVHTLCDAQLQAAVVALPQFPRTADAVKLAVSPCGTWVAFACDAGPVFVVAVVQRRRFSLGQVPGPGREVTALSFSLAGDLAVAYQSGLVQVARESDWRDDIRHTDERTCVYCGRQLTNAWSRRRHQEACRSQSPGLGKRAGWVCR